MINLDHLRSFIQVAQLGGFSQAAVVMRTSQSVLSRKVRALETELHQTLLLRTGRGVSLTEAGRHLLAHGTSLLQLASRLHEGVAAREGQWSGSVVVGLPPSLSREVTLPLVAYFKRELPHARLAIVEGLSSHLAEWIASGRVDIALVFNPQPQSRLETVPILSEDLCLISLASRPRRRTKLPVPVPMAELARFPLVLPEPAHVIRHLVDTQTAMRAVKLNVVWEVSSVPSIIDLVCAGHGHAILTARAVHASRQAGKLLVRRIIEPSIATTLYAAVSKNKRSSALTRKMLQLLPQLVLQRDIPPR
jgi:LysR family nitrogen assimilation transcriptional regulator